METKDGLTILMFDLPGLKIDDVRVVVAHGQLTVSGEFKHGKHGKDGKFSKSVEVPKSIKVSITPRRIRTRA